VESLPRRGRIAAGTSSLHVRAASSDRHATRVVALHRTPL